MSCEIQNKTFWPYFEFHLFNLNEASTGGLYPNKICSYHKIHFRSLSCSILNLPSMELAPNAAELQI